MKKENLLRGMQSFNSPVGVVLVWTLCGSWNALQPGRILVQYEIPYLLTLCCPAFIHSGRPLSELSSQLWSSFAHLFQRTMVVVVIPNASCLHCTENLMFLKIVFVRHLSLFSLGFEHYMCGVFLLTVPLKAAWLSKVLVLQSVKWRQLFTSGQIIWYLVVWIALCMGLPLCWDPLNCTPVWCL